MTTPLPYVMYPVGTVVQMAYFQGIVEEPIRPISPKDSWICLRPLGDHSINHIRFQSTGQTAVSIREIKSIIRQAPPKVCFPEDLFIL